MNDKATDGAGRFVVGVFVGDISRLSKPRLVDLVEIKKSDHFGFNHLVCVFLARVFEGGIPYNRVLLFTSDGAAYMIKADKNLETMFPEMLHVTCVVHELMRVAELVRSYDAITEGYVIKPKKLFDQSTARKHQFKQL